MLSTRPPPALSSSMEVIPKRFRSGSISSRLRSASELFDEGVIVDRQQKGVLKDLIISGDEALADALARYERGDKEPIKNLLRDGVLNRKSSLDLLGEAGDLDLAFLSVSTASNALAMRANLDAPFPMDDEELSFEISLQHDTSDLAKSPSARKFFPNGSFMGRAQMGLRSASLSSIPGNASGSLGGGAPGAARSLRLVGASLSSQGNAVGAGSAGVVHAGTTPPQDFFEISLLDESIGAAWAGRGGLRSNSFSSSMPGIKEMLEFDSDDLESPVSSPHKDGADEFGMVASSSSARLRGSPSLGAATAAPPLPKSRRQAQMRASRMESGSSSATSAPIGIPGRKSGGTPNGGSGSGGGGNGARSGGGGGAGTSSATKRSAAAAPPAPPTPLTAEERAASRRAQGVPMIGAYSPESRKLRVERFVAKRDRRVWKKKVKYDVRKNFADSRLRVKGRFVKKEDEEMLRDLMTMV